MCNIICELYYMVDNLVGQHELEDKSAAELMSQKEALQDKIAFRLGEDGQDMMEALDALNLKLETIHDQALFRAAMQLGTEIAHPAGLYSTSR